MLNINDFFKKRNCNIANAVLVDCTEETVNELNNNQQLRKEMIQLFPYLLKSTMNSTKYSRFYFFKHEKDQQRYYQRYTNKYTNLQYRIKTLVNDDLI